MTMLKKLISIGTMGALLCSLGLTGCGRPMVSVRLQMDTASASQANGPGAPTSGVV